jgi:hypothetical protein
VTLPVCFAFPVHSQSRDVCVCVCVWCVCGSVSWTFFICVYYRNLDTLPIAILAMPFLVLYLGVFFRYAPSTVSRWDLARQAAIALLFSVGVDSILVNSFSATPAGQQAKLQATGAVAAICHTVMCVQCVLCVCVVCDERNVQCVYVCRLMACPCLVCAPTPALAGILSLWLICASRGHSKIPPPCLRYCWSHTGCARFAG